MVRVLETRDLFETQAGVTVNTGRAIRERAFAAPLVKLCWKSATWAWLGIHSAGRAEMQVVPPLGWQR